MKVANFFKGVLSVIAILSFAVYRSDAPVGEVVVITSYIVAGMVGVIGFLALFLYALKHTSADTRIIDLNFGKDSLVNTTADVAAGALACALFCIATVFLI